MEYIINFIPKNKSQNISDKSFNKEWLNNLNLQADRNGKTSISTEDENFEYILEKMYELIDNGGNIVLLSIEEYRSHDDGWLELKSDGCTNKLDEYLETKYENNDFYFECFNIKAELIPKYYNVINLGGSIIVSEDFRKICLKENLTGIDFLWLEDESDTLSRQFFKPICKTPIGEKGIFKKYISTSKIYEDKLKYKTYIHQMNKNAVKNKYPLNILFSDKDISNKHTFFRDELLFVKKTLPDCDFAYSVYEGKMHIYISKRAKEIFNHYNMNLNCIPISIIDVMPAKQKYIYNIDTKIDESIKKYKELIQNKQED